MQKFKSVATCNFKECVGEDCVLFVGLPKNTFGKPVYSTAGEDQDGFISYVYHFRGNTTVVESLNTRGSQNPKCEYQIITKGPQEKEAMEIIKKRVEEWRPVKLQAK